MEEIKIIVREGDEYSIDRAYVNPENVGSITNDPNMKQKLNEGKLPENLDNRHNFSIVTLANGQAYTAVGSASSIRNQLSTNGPKIIHG